MVSFKTIVFYLTIVGGLISCGQEKKLTTKPFSYEQFRDSIRRSNPAPSNDTNNVFDNGSFDPGKDSIQLLLARIDTFLRRDSFLLQQLDTMVRHLKDQEEFTENEKAAIRSNLAAIDSFRLGQGEEPRSSCSKKDCLVYAEVIKSTQTLYLYIQGELKDSFKVSTGMKGYTTPSMDLKPRGPVFAKYTSRKFPGGNYKGLGNMPYAVFIKGGYAIHGTTTGNFSKLGRTASHGCIRLHPDNAIIFYELVKLIGLKNTWVTIKDSATP